MRTRAEQHTYLVMIYRTRLSGRLPPLKPVLMLHRLPVVGSLINAGAEVQGSLQSVSFWLVRTALAAVRVNCDDYIVCQV